MEYSYPAIFYPDDNGFLAVFPALNGLTVSGSDLSSTEAACEKAMEAWLFAIKLQGAKAPVSHEEPDPAETAACYNLPVDPARAQIRTITVDV